MLDKARKAAYTNDAEGAAYATIHIANAGFREYLTSDALDVAHAKIAAHDRARKRPQGSVAGRKIARRDMLPSELGLEGYV